MARNTFERGFIYDCEGQSLCTNFLQALNNIYLFEKNYVSWLDPVFSIIIFSSSPSRNVRI
jgi:hypothetical protein